ncbi:MAG: ABC transporter substrate-binding protein [Chloroflexi bacterium]|nr:ABC transporter substrate-binding protein [Chloroflexota bacterium]
MDDESKKEKPFGEMTFEEQTYEFTRQFAKRIGRRRFLQYAGGAAGAAIFAEILAACGGGAATPAATETGTAAATATGAASATETATAAATETAAATATQASAGGGTPKTGGTIKIGRAADSDTLDPQKTSLLVSHEILTNIFDPLVYLDAAGKVYPALADSWEFSSDNKVVTLKLHQGVKFHDGSPFNATIVKRTVERQMAKATASPTAWMLGPLTTVDVVDDYTVAFNYSDPFVPLWVGLSYSYCAPLPMDAVEAQGDAFGRNPIGSGPYKFVSWDPDKGITLEKYADHTWASPFFKNTGAPYLDGAQYLVIPEDATRISSLQSGEIDMIHGADAVPISKVPQLQSMDGVKVEMVPCVGVYELMLNTTKKPLDNQKVRQAINYAIDKAGIIKLVMGGFGEPAYSVIASSFSSVYDADIKTKIGYEYNVDKAKALLKEAGQEAGFQTDITLFAGDAWTQLGQVVKENLAAVGIDLTINSLPAAEVFADAAKGTAGIYLCWYTYSDPDIIYQFGHSGQSFVWDRHVNPDLDKLIEEQRVEFDPAKRKDLFTQIQETFAEQAYWVPLFEGKYVAAMKSYVNGVSIDTLGFHHLQDMWMDKA